MSFDDIESAQHAVSELLYSAILLVCAWIMACDNEWREVNRNLAEAVVSEISRFIVASCVRRRVLRFSLALYVVC